MQTPFGLKKSIHLTEKMFLDLAVWFIILKEKELKRGKKKKKSGRDSKLSSRKDKLFSYFITSAGQSASKHSTTAKGFANLISGLKIL